MSQVEKLRVERDRIKARLEEVEALIQAYEDLEIKMQRVLSGEPQYFARPIGNFRATVGASHNADETQSGRRRSDDVAKFEAFVRDLLKTADEPMTRNDILARAEASDIPVGGQNPANTISARMARMGDVVARRGVGYWLKSRESELFAEKTPSNTPVETQVFPMPPGFD